MTPRAEILWSYLIGRGPVGEPVPVRRGEIAADLGMVGTIVSQRIRELMDAGVIARVGVSLFVVKERIGPCWTLAHSPERRRPLVAYAGKEAA